MTSAPSSRPHWSVSDVPPARPLEAGPRVRYVLGALAVALTACSAGPETSSPTPEPAETSTPTAVPSTPTQEPATPTPDAVATPTLPPNQLDDLAWYEPNVSSLRDFVPAHMSEDPRNGPLLVTSWDNTAVYGRMTEAVLRYQLQNLAFKIEPGALDEVLPVVAGSAWDEPGTVSSLGDISIQALHNDIVNAYRDLYQAYEPTGGCSSSCQTLEVLQNTNEFKSLFAKMLFLYQGLLNHPEVGPAYTSVMLTRLFAGFSDAEARQVAVNAWTFERELAIQSITYTSPGSGESGQVSGTYEVGLRAYLELADLFDYARKAGYDSWVVAASPQWVIQAALGALTGYGIDEANVVGIQLEKARTDAGQVYTITPKAGVPIPYGDGKVTVVSDIIGKEPTVIVGGTAEDLALIEASGSAALVLLLNRMEPCPFSDLYLQADDSGGAGPGDLLLQGIDNDEGRFRPEQTTLLLDSSAAEPLPDSCP